MHPRWLTLLIITFVTVVVFVFFTIRLQPVWNKEAFKKQQQTTETSLTQPDVTFVNPKKGAAEPKITLVEFSDFACEACREFAQTLDALIRTIPDVQIVWKNMPNESLHELATPAAIAAHCAGEQDKFWEYHDVLFENQIGLSETTFFTIATDLGLDTDSFERCYNNRDTLPLVRKDFEEAIALSIPATPALFIGTDRYVGAYDLNALLTIVRQKLANP